MYTYRSTNTKNGKFYIGSTNNFEKRKKEHLRSKKNYPFQNALRKNPEGFEWEVWSDDCHNPVLEQALLDMWFGKEQCYNLNPYACGGCLEHSEETKRKMSQSKKGKPLTDKNKEGISKARKGMRFTEEHKRNISLSKRGKSHGPWNKGKSWYYNLDTLKSRLFFEDPGDGWRKGMRP